MRRRAAAVTVALALLSWTTTAPAGKPIRTLPRPSASRSAGPESLARAARRPKTRAAESRPAKRGPSRIAGKAGAPKGPGSREHAAVTDRRQRSETARGVRGVTREVRLRQRRGEKRRPGLDQRTLRKSVAAEEQPARQGSRRSPMRGRAAVRKPKPGDDEDATATAISPRQAFSSISPLKSVDGEAGTAILLPSLRVDSLYDSRGRLNVPAPLYGSREILLHQNEMADRDGLDRIRDNSDLEDLLRQRKLVALPAGGTLQVDDRLPADRRYSRPWTAAFLSVLARDFYANFHQPIYITSAVRTVQVQQRLVRTNGNAAPVSGDNASPHLTGQAVDIAKKGLSVEQIAWLRTYLQRLIGDGKIDVEEEFRQACFHVSVYRSYLPAAPKISIASAREQPDSTRP